MFLESFNYPLSEPMGVGAKESPPSNFFQYHIMQFSGKKSMHSSRNVVVDRIPLYRGGGGVWPGGCLLKGVSPQGGCLPGGVSRHAMGQTPP